MMNFDLFKEHIVTALQEIFGGTKITTNTVDKNNGLKLEAVLIHDVNRNISPSIYINSYYEDYLDGRELDDIVNSIATLYRDNMPDCDFDLTLFSDWQKAKENIIYCLVNYEKNRDLLSSIPHIRFLDFAIIFRCLVDSMNGIATILINNEHLKLWNVSVEELHAISKINTPKLLPLSFRSLLSVLTNMIDEDMMEEATDDYPMFVISNQKNVNGSACILYENVLKDFADKIHSNLYILPSSIHEVIILPADSDKDVAELKEMVLQVNATMVSSDEFLSDNVYLYDREKAEIIIII